MLWLCEKLAAKPSALVATRNREVHKEREREREEIERNSSNLISKTMMSNNSPPHSLSCSGTDKKHWWLSTRKVVDKYVRDARLLISTRDTTEMTTALSLLDSALSLSPRYELALELKARCLLYLRRFKDVADMLQDYIPSYKMTSYDSDNSNSSSGYSDGGGSSSKERVKLLPHDDSGFEGSFKCFSVKDLKKKLVNGLCKNCEKEGQWRYIVLGQACSHLGLMDDAVALLQTGKRLASAAFRRESICWSEDSFSFSHIPLPSSPTSNNTLTTYQTPPLTESESISHLLAQTKLLIRRRTAALAALDAGLYSEAIRHFSKILDGRRAAPQAFLAECYMNRSIAYRSAGRIAESIADCNRALALDTNYIQALQHRSSLFELIGCITDAVHDLEHVKLLFNSILRDRKLPGPGWKPQSVRYREIPGKLCSLTTKMQVLKRRIAMGEMGNVDYYGLIGVRRGCSRSELERAHLLLVLRHKPDKSIGFIDRCQFADERDIDEVRDRARMSGLLLYRLIQKGYSNVMTNIMDEEAAEKEKKAASVAAAAAALQETNKTAATTATVLVQEEQQKQKAVQAPTTTTAHRQQQEIKRKKPEVRACGPGENQNQKVVVVMDNNNNKGNNSVGGSAGSDGSVGSSCGGGGGVYQGVFCRDVAAVGNLLSQVGGFDRPLSLKYEAALTC